MTKINFQNLPNTTTPVNASNLNQLQTNIENTLNTYSTSETRIGTWINGKPLYRKVVDTGTLPNDTYKDVDTGLNSSNINVVKIGGGAKATTGVQLPLPFISTASENSISISLQATGKVRLDTGVDRSNFTSSYVIIEYIKTTD